MFPRLFDYIIPSRHVNLKIQILFFTCWPESFPGLISGRFRINFWYHQGDWSEACLKAPHRRPWLSALKVLKRLGERLAARRAALIEAAGEDTGTPCTVAGMEIDLAVEHLLTMDQGGPRRPGEGPLRHRGRGLPL